MKDFIEHYKEPLKWLIVLFFAPGLIQGIYHIGIKVGQALTQWL
ncbi:hypothetical protein [Dolosigranulum pigrum]|nr:hypothetical protein [Dolosigranulum pigrum]